MDIQMPVMDGIQATKEIRRLEHTNAAAGYPPVTPSSETPLRTPSDTSADTKSNSSPYRSSVIIVALTASSLQSDRVAALAAGCNDFLTKPVSLVWLNNKIIEWGSIKALQMWADLRPEVINNLSTGQARNVADRLHVPKDRTVRLTAGNPHTPPPITAGAGPSSSGLLASAPASSGLPTSTSSMLWSPDSTSSNYWQNLGIEPTPPPSAETLNELAKGSYSFAFCLWSWLLRNVHHDHPDLAQGVFVYILACFIFLIIFHQAVDEVLLPHFRHSIPTQISNPSCLLPSKKNQKCRKGKVQPLRLPFKSQCELSDGTGRPWG